MVSINIPDCETAHIVEGSTAAYLRAYAHLVWMTLLDLVLEQASGLAGPPLI